MSPPTSLGHDRRRLGALLTGIAIEGTPICLDDARLARGFHGTERHGDALVRWTNGNGVLSLPDALTDRRLEITVASLADTSITGDARLATACRGAVELIGSDRLTGWAWDPAAPDVPVMLRILADGVVIGRVLANQYRSDLFQAGIGNGRNGFEIGIATRRPLAHQVIRILRDADGLPLARVPMPTEPADALASVV